MPRSRSGCIAKKENQKQAVALSYDAIDELPRVVAQATGELAALLLSYAQEHNIPVKQDRRLAEMLSQLQVGNEISSETFRLVAAIISFLYHADKLWRESHPFLDPLAGPAPLA